MVQRGLWCRGCCGAEGAVVQRVLWCRGCCGAEGVGAMPYPHQLLHQLRTQLHPGLPGQQLLHVSVLQRPQHQHAGLALKHTQVEGFRHAPTLRPMGIEEDFGFYLLMFSNPSRDVLYCCVQYVDTQSLQAKHHLDI